MKIKQFLFFSLLWFAQNQSFAQEKLSLKDAIATALLNNYDIKLVNNQVAIAQNNVNLGNAGMLPNLLGNFRTGGGVQDAVQTQASGTKRVINDARNTNLAYGVGLDWTIFDGFRMFANLDRLKALEQQGKVNAKAQILTTISAVVTACLLYTSDAADE